MTRAAARAASALPSPSRTRGWLLTLRSACIMDRPAAFALMRSTVARIAPPGAKPALLDAIAAVCVETLLDPHDFEFAVARVERDRVESPDEALETLVDWTARRERARVARAEAARDPVPPRSTGGKR